MDSNTGDRHCAFCLKSVPAKEVKLCGKCQRRAYCGRDCQIADWTRKKGGPAVGQAHKKWCGLEVCEEDLDWKIIPVEGKGLGVVALKPIAEKSRIMVDACLLSPEGHAGIADLMPKDGTPAAKFKLNSLGCGDTDDVDAVLCLRIARVNHNCNVNAGHIYLGRDLKVKVLFAERDIKAGEEICISYTSFGDMVKKTSGEATRFMLEHKWGIFCPDDCICRDALLQKRVKESWKLDEEIIRLGSLGQPGRALKAVNSLMTIHIELGSSWMEKIRTLYDGFQMAVTKRSTLAQAKDFLGKIVKIQEEITHPEDSKLKKYQDLCNDLSGHRNYLLLD